MKYKAVVLDFDGTIADTSKGIVATMAETYHTLGAPVPTEEAMRGVIGLPLITALQQAGNLNQSRAEQAVEVYKSLFATVELGQITLFDGVAETLELLHQNGLSLAIATSRNRESLDAILQRYQIGDLFAFIATNNDGFAHKPAPDMVWAALNHFNIKAHEALVVGDTTYDLEMGRRAGCDTCGVTYGNHATERLKQAQPNYLINQFQTLTDIVLV